jgi:hypothetical protein
MIAASGRRSALGGACAVGESALVVAATQSQPCSGCLACSHRSGEINLLTFILFLPLSEQSLSTTELDAFLFNRYNRHGNGLEKSCEQFLVFASAMLESQ